MDTAFLSGTEGLRDVPEAALRALVDAGEARELPCGQALFSAGDAFHDAVYVVVDGHVDVERAGRGTQSAGPGYLVGLSSYFTGAPYAATASARGDVQVLAVGAADLRALERAHPALAAAFDRFIGASLRERRVSTGGGTAALTEPVRGVMSTPLATCTADTTLADAVAQMQRAGSGSLVVTGDDAETVVTYASIAARLVEPDASAVHDPVDTASRELPRIDADTPLWQAQDLQIRTGSKYLLVEHDGRAVGMLSQTDVVRSLLARQARLAASVREAGGFAELRRRYESMATLAAEFLETNRLARVAVRSLSEAHRAVQGRCIELTLEELRDAGAGGPPGPFALIIMGSGGRREMMLDPDQDNGIILDDTLEGDAGARAWFERFADRLNVNLDACGYVLCPGDIMARNPMFHKTLSQWAAQITRMSERPNEKAARWSSIVFDFDTQFGDRGLTRELRAHVNRALQDRPRLLNYMVDDDAQGRAPLNWFNRLIATGEREGKDTVDVKRNGLRMVANAARILALREGIGVTNTSARISALARAGVIGRDFEATILDAYDELLAILLGHQVRQRRAGYTPDKEVAPQDLTEIERESLRVSMRAVKRFQELLQDQVGGVQI